MEEKTCDNCFYTKTEAHQFPCSVCSWSNKWVDINVFKPDTKQIREWDDNDAFVVKNNDVINSPQHYTKGNFEVIDVIEDWDLNFRLANSIKYIARHKHKGKPLEDLKKALWYLEREISKWESLSKN
jgi:hypothetical protein